MGGWGVFFFFRGWAREKLDVFFGVLFLPKKQGGFFFQKNRLLVLKVKNEGNQKKGTLFFQRQTPSVAIQQSSPLPEMIRDILFVKSIRP